jgi:hypothetical protein
MALRYRGINSSGSGVTGSLSPADLVEWVRVRFDSGWRALSVIDGDAEVAGIGQHPDTGRRTWWAETIVHPDFDRLNPMERAQLAELVAAARATAKDIAELRAEFAEAHADSASSNDIVQLLDDWLVKHGQPTVLYA